MSSYWKWDNAVPTELLDIAMHDADTGTLVDGKIQGRAGVGEIAHQVRSSTLSIHGPVYWLNAVLVNFAYQANIQAGWNRPLTVSPFMQYARYVEGQFYSWHADNEILTDDPFQRKLTTILMLSDKTEYEGGCLEFEGREPVELNKGSVIVFPSLLRHRVTPVTNGLRITAVNWTLGPTSW